MLCFLVDLNVLNCPSDFKLWMMIPVTVESVATLKPSPENPYVHLKHADFSFFNNNKVLLI